LDSKKNRLKGGFFYFLIQLYKRKADPLAGFSYHKQDQPIKQKLVNKNLAIHIANHAFL